MLYSSPEWKAYTEYNDARTSLLDYGVPAYSDYKETYEKLGLDKSAYNLMRAWTYTDTEKINADTFRTLAALRQEKIPDKNFFKDFLSQIGKGVIKVNAFWVCAATLLIWLIKGRKGAGNILGLLVECLVVAALYLFLFYRGRFLYNRVDTCIWLGAFLTVAVLIRKSVSKPAGIVLCVLLTAAGLFVSSWGDRFRMKTIETERLMQKDQEALKEINEDQEHVYLTKGNIGLYSASFDMWESIPVGIGDNQFPLGGWTANTPTYLSVLERYGVENPFRDMIGNERIYLIDNNIELTMKYIRKWYDKDAEAALVKKTGSWQVYKIEP